MTKIKITNITNDIAEGHREIGKIRLIIWLIIFGLLVAISIIFWTIYLWPREEVQSRLPTVKNRIISAWITVYTDVGTMASGKQTYLGATAVSDRSLKFGTTIAVEGLGVFKVEDYTAKWVHARQGLTIDLWLPITNKEAILFGKQRRLIQLTN